MGAAGGATPAVGAGTDAFGGADEVGSALKSLTELGFLRALA